jgi:hypothetical protein
VFNADFTSIEMLQSCLGGDGHRVVDSHLPGDPECKLERATWAATSVTIIKAASGTIAGTTVLTASQ